MKILSLFDGISCARVALEKLKIPVEKYYASEIDEPAITISKNNWFNEKGYFQCGDVSKIDSKHFTDIDLLIGGSPCQDLSIAKKERKGLDGNRSSLFWEYVRILREVKPKYFILENVASMPREAKAIITKELGVEPIMIDAALVSAQRRKRLFWTNIPGVVLPKDKEIYSWDIVEMGAKEIYQYRRTYWREIKSGKIPTLTANMGTGGNNVPYVVVKEATKKGYAVAFSGDTVDTTFPNSKTRRGRVGNKIKNLMTGQGIKIFDGKELRPLTPIECERAQSLPDNYTEGVSKTQRYKMLGNAFNADVVAHILSFIKDEYSQKKRE